MIARILRFLGLLRPASQKDGQLVQEPTQADTGGLSSQAIRPSASVSIKGLNGASLSVPDGTATSSLPAAKTANRPAPFQQIAQRSASSSPMAPIAAQSEKSQKPQLTVPRSSNSNRTESRRLLQQRLELLPSDLDDRARAIAETCHISTKEMAALEERLAAGIEATPVEGQTGRPIEVVLGLDFGTTSTKLVARLPYESGSPTFAVPAPLFARAEGHPYLWSSRLWLTPDGVFSLCPLPRAAVACAIKANLMTSPSAPRAVLRVAGAEANSEEVAAAFLALQLRQARGWLKSERSTMFRHRKMIWSYNFGFPAASLNDNALRESYERCTVSALILADGRDAITLAAVRSALAVPAANAAAELEQASAALVPEIAAAVSGFANSTRLDDGLYALVDVGGGTVDCCTFNLFKSADGGARCPIFEAEVQLLGAEPWSICQHDELLGEELRHQLDLQQRGVIWRTKKDRYPASERWISGLPLFFVGGGIESPPHQGSTRGLDGWLRKHNAKGGGVRITPLPPPDGLDHSLCEAGLVHRLAVAIGLSLPVTDIPEVELPGNIEDVFTGKRPPTDGNYVGKEQT